MTQDSPASLQVHGVSALLRMEEALRLLDHCGAGADVAGHLDLAICRLRDAIADDVANNGRIANAGRSTGIQVSDEASQRQRA